MSKFTIKELALVQSTLRSWPATSLEPGPGFSSSDAKPAVRRCCLAWQRAFKAYMDDPGDQEAPGLFAAQDASKAYCNAMPMLVGYEGVRDFIACTAHGILIGAIPPERSGQLLYAAQVALSLVQREPKPAQSVRHVTGPNQGVPTPPH